MIDDYEPASDYEDQLDAIRVGYLGYDDTHCKHGTFVGHWAGPDYMCGACESGITDEEWEAGNRRADRRARRVKALQPKLVQVIRDVNAAVREDPDSAESQRRIDRLVKYMHWGVRAPYDILALVKEERA